MNQSSAQFFCTPIINISINTWATSLITIFTDGGELGTGVLKSAIRTMSCGVIFLQQTDELSLGFFSIHYEEGWSTNLLGYVHRRRGIEKLADIVQREVCFAHFFWEISREGVAQTFVVFTITSFPLFLCPPKILTERKGIRLQTEKMSNSSVLGCYVEWNWTIWLISSTPKQVVVSHLHHTVTAR